MGQEVRETTFTREDRQRYRAKVRRCLDVFERMLAENQFDFDDPMTGMEIELNLVDDDGAPTMRNAEVLALIDDPAFQTELGRFNLEINIPPRSLARGRDGRARERRAQPAQRRAGQGTRRAAPAW